MKKAAYHAARFKRTGIAATVGSPLWWLSRVMIQGHISRRSSSIIDTFHGVCRWIVSKTQTSCYGINDVRNVLWHYIELILVTVALIPQHHLKMHPIRFIGHTNELLLRAQVNIAGPNSQSDWQTSCFTLPLTSLNQLTKTSNN